jgi:hypothetical protein
MAPNPCKTKVPASTLLSQPDSSLIGDLTHVGAAGATENQNFIDSRAFSSIFVLLLDPALNLFQLRDLP